MDDYLDEYSRGSLYSKKVTFGVLSLLVVVVFTFNLIRTLTDTGTLSLVSLLQFFADAPTIDMSMASFEFISTITDWGTFQFIADFLNIFITLANVGVYASKGIINVVLFLAHVLRFLFVG